MENQGGRDDLTRRSEPVGTFAGAATPGEATAVGEPVDAGFGTGSLTDFETGAGTLAGMPGEQAGAFVASSQSAARNSGIGSGSGSSQGQNQGQDQGQGQQGGGIAEGAMSKVDAGLGKAAGGIDKLVGTIRDRGDQLGQSSGPAGTVGSVATAAADKLEGASQYLHQTDTDRLMTDLEALIRRKPVESLLAAAGVGFVLAKVLR